MSRRKILLSVLVVVASTLVLAYQFGRGGSDHGDNSLGNFFSRLAPIVGRADGNVVRVSGNIELTAVEASFKIPGKVIERCVDEGDIVKPGDKVAALECADLEKQVAIRKAEYEAAKAAWEEVRNGSRKEEKEAARAAMEKAAKYYEELLHGSRPQEIEAAQALLQSTEVEKARLNDELERAKKLYFRDHVLTQEDYDRQAAAYRVATARWREALERYNLVKLGPREEQKQQAKAALDQATWQYQLVEAGPRQEVRDQAWARLQQAEAAWELARTQLSYAEVFAPRLQRPKWQANRVGKSAPPEKAVVLSKNIEPGDYVAPGTPVVTIGDLALPWLRAYIDEPDLQRVKYGQKARVTTSRYADKHYVGWVGFIASEAEFTPKNVQTEKERTRLVYRIKIYIDNRDLELKRGMPADAEILLDSAPTDSPQ